MCWMGWLTGIATVTKWLSFTVQYVKKFSIRCSSSINQSPLKYNLPNWPHAALQYDSESPPLITSYLWEIMQLVDSIGSFCLVWTYRRSDKKNMWEPKLVSCDMAKKQVLKPHNGQPKSKKINLILHIIFLWKGTVFSGYSPSEHHHVPDGTTGCDSALFSDDYPLLLDIYMYDHRNVTDLSCFCHP